MNFSNEVSKLFNNKYFLYFVLFLAATNVLGYLVTNKLNAIIFFTLIGFLTYQFSKNMAIVLLVAIVATNFMMANKTIREGLENSTDATSTALEKAGEIDPEIAQATNAVQNASSNEDLKKKMQAPGTTTTSVPPLPGAPTANNDSEDNNDTVYPLDPVGSDPNNLDLNKASTEVNAPEGFGAQLSNNKKGNHGKSGPRLDYAATIEQSYGQLDELLGGDSIKQLSKDTQNLMAQQQNLFNTMNQMVPVLEGAQNMLQKFDIGGLTNSLNSIKGLGILGGGKKEEGK
jgi:hypothetical protein